MHGDEHRSAARRLSNPGDLIDAAIMENTLKTTDQSSVSFTKQGVCSSNIYLGPCQDSDLDDEKSATRLLVSGGNLGDAGQDQKFIVWLSGSKRSIAPFGPEHSSN